MQDDIKNILITTEQIQAAVARLGADVTRDYAGLDLHLLGVLRGAAPFVCDLMRTVVLPVTVDFIGVTSYGPQARGVVRITKDLDESITDRHVLVIEGIVDTGLTLSYILRNLATRGPASLKVCTLLNKPARRIIDVPITYSCFEIPDEFVVGYGLDWRQKYRNLPYVATLKAEVLTT
jgi:hypoxanthine phosphoribosyltransferase